MLHRNNTKAESFVLSFRLGRADYAPLLEEPIEVQPLEKKSRAGNPVESYLYRVGTLESEEGLGSVTARVMASELYQFGCRHFYDCIAATTGAPAKQCCFKLQLLDAGGNLIDEATRSAKRSRLDWDEILPDRDESQAVLRSHREVNRHARDLADQNRELLSTSMDFLKDGRKDDRLDTTTMREHFQALLNTTFSLSDIREEVARKEALAEAGYQKRFIETEFGQQIGLAGVQLMTAAMPAMTNVLNNCAKLIEGRLAVYGVETEVKVHRAKRRAAKMRAEEEAAEAEAAEAEAERKRKADAEAEAEQAAE